MHFGKTTSYTIWGMKCNDGNIEASWEIVLVIQERN